MKCEICHKADACRAITREDAGEDEELYVCEECAKAERLRRQRKSSRTRKVTGLPPGVEMSVTEISAPIDGMEPPPIVGAILNAFQDFVNGMERPSTAQEGSVDEKKKDFSTEAIGEIFRLRDGFHLAGIHLIGEMEAVRRALHALDMDIEGFEVDGVKDAGHSYRLTYSCSDETAKRVAEAIIREERNARVRLFEELPRVYGDALCRALAILKNCRLLSSGELFDLLSPLRIAAKERMLDGITFRQIENILASIDLSGKEDLLDPLERDRVDSERADKMNRRFEDVVLNERAEEKFL